MSPKGQEGSPSATGDPEYAMSIQSPAQKIAAKMITLLEQGVKPWTRPWETRGGCALPLRASGQPYRGINVLLLWAESAAMSYQSSIWMTYRQASALGGQVRRGETGAMVVYYGSAKDRRGGEGDEAVRYRFLKAFHVFNCDQIEGLPEQFRPAPAPPTAPLSDRVTQIEAGLVRACPDVRFGGDQAYYNHALDLVVMPKPEQFRDPEQYLATLGHEAAHSTGHSSRLNREFGARFGDAKYSAEECVAEITAALLGSTFGLRPDHIHDHAAYLKDWIGALKDDPAFILKVAALAQSAADYIIAQSGLASADRADDLAADSEFAEAA